MLNGYKEKEKTLICENAVCQPSFDLSKIDIFFCILHAQCQPLQRKPMAFPTQTGNKTLSLDTSWGTFHLADNKITSTTNNFTANWSRDGSNLTVRCVPSRSITLTFAQTCGTVSQVDPMDSDGSDKIVNSPSNIINGGVFGDGVFNNIGPIDISTSARDTDTMPNGSATINGATVTYLDGSVHICGRSIVNHHESHSTHTVDGIPIERFQKMIREKASGDVASQALASSIVEPTSASEISMQSFEIDESIKFAEIIVTGNRTLTIDPLMTDRSLNITVSDTSKVTLLPARVVYPPMQFEEEGDEPACKCEHVEESGVYYNLIKVNASGNSSVGLHAGSKRIEILADGLAKVEFKKWHS